MTALVSQMLGQGQEGPGRACVVILVGLSWMADSLAGHSGMAYSWFPSIPGIPGFEHQYGQLIQVELMVLLI